MAGFDDMYPNLPGQPVQFKDNNLALKDDPTPPSTESVLFLGTATDGPVNQPIRVTPSNAYSIFGKQTLSDGRPNGATLLNAFEEAWNAGSRDVRLMRVTGQTAVLSLKGTAYTNVSTQVQRDTLGAAKGNAATTFTLPNGGIDPTSLVVHANGLVLDATKYTAVVGTASDSTQAPNPEVKATLTINEDATDMLANVTVDYTYTYTDGTGAQTASVHSNNLDSAGAAMIVAGKDVVYDLTQVPLAGLQLYADSAQITDATVFTIDSANKKITVHATNQIRLGQALSASYSYNVSAVVTPTIELESVYGGDLYNGGAGTVENQNGIIVVTLTKPDQKKSLLSEPPLVFRSSDYANFQLLVNAINGSNNNNFVRARTDYGDQLTTTLEAKPQTYFSGGSDELYLSKQEMYERLGGVKDPITGQVISQGAYQLLENYKTDYVVPLGVFADDVLVGQYDNFAYQLALACAVMSHFNNVTIGYITTSTPTDTSLASIEAQVQKLEALPNLFLMRAADGTIIKDGDGNTIDLGQFIEVIAGPDIVVNSTRMGLVASNSAATYAGFITQLPVQSSPTNKQLPSVVGARFEYSSNQLNRLTGARYVTYRIKNGNQVAVVDAMTAAHAGSDYQRLSTARITKEAVNQIRDVADPYLGESNDAAARNALTAAISKRLDQMVAGKALLSYDFNIIATSQMELMGEAQIELTLQAPRELRKLTTVVGLQ